MKKLTMIVLVALVVLTVAVLRPPRARAQVMSIDPTQPRIPWTGTCVLTAPVKIIPIASCLITNAPQMPSW
jgi:hypothetical protein